MKKIKYYRTFQQCGIVRELIHPDSAADGKIISILTCQRPINARIRGLIRDLTGGQISFVETVAPHQVNQHLT